MNGLRPLVTALAFMSFFVGILFSYSSNDGEHRFGHTLAVAGAILIAGLFIGVSISGTDKRLK